MNPPVVERDVDLNVEIPESLDDRLEDYIQKFKKQKLTKKAVVAAALREYLDRHDTSDGQTVGV